MSRATFATAPESHGERRRELADPAALRVPGRGRVGEPERLRVPGEHLRPGVAERGERARRAAELRGQALETDLDSSQRRASSSPASQPAALSPNVTGTACWSSVRPAIGVSRCARASSAAALRGGTEVLEQRLERPRGHEHRGGVEDVLAGRAAVDVLGGRALDRLGQRGLQRDHGVAGPGGALRDRRGVEAIGVARRPRSPPPPRRRSAPRPPARARARPRRRASPAATPRR